MSDNSFLNKFFGSCLVILIIILILGALFAFLFMELWNWVVPIFWENAPILTFWEAYAVIVLLSIIGRFFKK